MTSVLFVPTDSSSAGLGAGLAGAAAFVWPWTETVRVASRQANATSCFNGWATT